MGDFLLQWLLTPAGYNLATVLSSAYPFHLICHLFLTWTLCFSNNLAALSYRYIISCFWVFIFLTLSAVTYSFFPFLPGSLFFIPWDPVQEITFLQEVFPYLVSGLWGHLCHYSYLFVIISVPHQSEFLKATHLSLFAFLLPNRVVSTEQAFNTYLSSILGEVCSPAGEWV